MKTLSLVKPEFEERHFGTSFDPLLTGVAQGLATLFPPVETVRHRDGDDGTKRANESGNDPDED